MELSTPSMSQSDPNPSKLSWVSMKTILVNPSDLHPAIRSSHVFRDLIDIDEEDNEVKLIKIPKQFYFENFEDLSQDNLLDMLNKLRYWFIEPLPFEILLFCFQNKNYISNLYFWNLDSDLSVSYFKEIKLIVKNENETMCKAAVKNNNLNLLKIAYEHGCPWNEVVCSIASNNGYLDCLKYAHEHGCSWDEYTCIKAAENGHLHCLKYAHENGCPWNKRTCEYAAKNGHLNCLKYAHEHGCPWDEYTCSSAAESGHLDCLKYAHEHGCPWDEYTCKKASDNGSFHCLKYAIENGCPWIKGW